METNEPNRSLVPVPDASLAITGPQAGRVLSEMVGETLALARQETLVTSREYLNSLGMKFVPVKDTQVLFSVWETRVQDYEVFAEETKLEWPKPDFVQEPTHPAVNVNWEDAVAFCAWLSKKEGRTYRLPTDEEWSVAVGLGTESGSTPQERSGKAAGYPWGKSWPPPRGAGNYGPELKVDDFAKTSPVGNFAANSFGLYDLGGNVWEWCEDEVVRVGFHPAVGNATYRYRVNRGGSWFNDNELSLRSSYRHNANPTGRDSSTGFRCVLVVPDAAVVLTPEFKIGDYTWREPDYRQILLWAEALRMEPAMVIEKLVGGKASRGVETRFQDGRMLSLSWNLAELPLFDFNCGDGLSIERLRLYEPLEILIKGVEHPEVSIRLRSLRVLACWCKMGSLILSGVPNLTNLDLYGSRLRELDLSNVPDLTELYCSRARLKKLDLSHVPRLRTLRCDGNLLMELNLSHVPKLTELWWGDNQPANLDLSQIPNLTVLWWAHSQLIELDLSAVPNLTELYCHKNLLLRHTAERQS